jgi:hypothetical protein
MPLQKGGGIPVSELAGRVSKSVSMVLKDHPALSGAVDEIAYFPDPGIVGFILKDQVADLNVRNLAKVTSNLAKPFTDLGNPAAVLLNKKILVGFFPKNREFLLGR